MKNIIFSAAIAVIMLTSFASCRKCKICTKSSEPELRVCENDYSSKTEYGIALDIYEVSGYECN